MRLTACVCGSLAALVSVAEAASDPAVHLVSPAATSGAPQEESAPGQALEARRALSCTSLARSPWPRTSVERRALLQQLEAARASCKDHPEFLAALGGTWLEEGEPGQALLWLERALMLDGNLLSAQADHALALAALGDSTARDELVTAWRKRTDIPPLLVQRLTSSRVSHQPQDQAATSRRWAQFREASVYLGHESNLNHSPRLSELTLTPPDGGPITLPVEQPLVPRPGPAVLAEVSWQLAFAPQAGTILQAGAQGVVREAPGNADTNWHHVQAAVGGVQLLGDWRVALHASAGRMGGALNQPHRLARWSLAIERDGLGCSHRWLVEQEDRRFVGDGLNDGRTVAGLWSALCPITAWQGWKAGLALRTAVDTPTNADRPGGRQRLHSVGLRLLGYLDAKWKIDATLRRTRGLDEQGYSPLLEDNARRSLTPTQFNVELSRPAATSLGRDAAGEYLVQAQGIHQASNLGLFRYSSLALFAGFRFKW